MEIWESVWLFNVIECNLIAFHYLKSNLVGENMSMWIFSNIHECVTLHVFDAILFVASSTNLQRLDHWAHSMAAVVTSIPVVMILSSQIIMPIVAKVKIIITCGLEYCLESRTKEVSRWWEKPTKIHRETTPCFFVWCLWSTVIIHCVLFSLLSYELWI